MVGRNTERTMKKLGICTIGDLAGVEPSILEIYLERWDWYFIPLQMDGMRLQFQ